ncbi:MAG: HAMP domain-containing protein [Caldilineaceae bacterium]|nr:HAMP domain-containing protein [Caldilineaceae bacterium]
MYPTVGGRRRSIAVTSLILAATMTLCAVLTNRLLTGYLTSEFERQARERAAIMAAGPSFRPIQNDADALKALLNEWQAISGARLALLDSTGRVTAASDAPRPESDSSNARPEAAAAPAAHEEADADLVQRVDPVTGQESLFITLPVAEGSPAVARLRFVLPMTGLNERLALLRNEVRGLAALAGLLLLTLSILHQERTAQTIRQLTDVADRITTGELSARILSLNTGDMGKLTRAFNRMAGELEREIQKQERGRDRLYTVMHVMADGVLILTRKGKVRMINPAAAALLHTNESTAEGRSFIQVVRDHRIAEVWQRCQERGEQEVAALELGPDRFLRIIVTPFLRGADRGYVVILQDLTRMRRLQTVRQDFVSNVSHELRTPLASLRALADTLRDGALDDPPAAIRFLDRMDVEVDSLTQLVEELFELVRIESGQVPLHLRRASVGSVAGGGAERLRAQADRKELKLTVAISEGLPDILVDPDRVQQVITNLVHNAVKFTPPKGSISVSAQRHTDEFIVVSVSDTGIGIPPDDLPRIFERFYKIDRARTSGGTGLGLAIAKHIVQSHGGAIWAESMPERGSIFYLTLPIFTSEEG